jgi:glyoxylase-like metal-dependent hydrolase (beta-lactamase superfamily II)
MTLFRGSREIQIHFFGRAHTGGDITVYLPAEKLAFTGDMMLQGPSFLGDGYVDEWVETLENLKGLAFETIVPGHGNPFTDRDLIGHVQAYYADLWEKVAAMHEQGIPVADAARDVDMTNHASTLGIRRKGVDPQAVGRIYARLDGAD